jgi:hypothetical protein
MNINLDRLIGKEAAHRLRNLGLHKVAAARLRAEGYDIPGDLDLRSAIQVLGTKTFLKNAEYSDVIQGLAALHELEQSSAK